MNIPENFDRWMFDYKEGNLSGAEKEAFENFLLQNPQYEMEMDAWNNAFIENEEFEYPHAHELTKDRKVAAGWYYSAAAAIVLLIGGTIFFNSNSNINHNSPVASFDYEDSPEAFADRFIKNGSQLGNEVDVIADDIASDASTANNHADNSFNTAISNSNGIADYENSVEENTDVNSLNDWTASNNSGSNYVSNKLGDQTDSDVNIGEGHNEAALSQEFNKFGGTEEHGGQYLTNPDASELNFDVAKNGSYDFSSWQNKVKRFYHKLEKMFDNPIGLTNLRDPELVMPNSSVLAFNPAFAGGMLSPRFEMNYRNQWLGAEHNSQQLTMSFDNYIYQMRGGVGLVLNAKDYKYGQFGDYNMSLIYSPKMLVNKNVVIEPAVKMTLGVLNANGNKLSPESQIELDRGRTLSTPAAPQMKGNQQLWYKDYGLGLVVNTKWFYAGFSADNLNKHFENVYNEEGYATPTSTPIKINAIIGTDWESKNRPLNKPLSLSAFVAYDQFGERQEAWGGLSSRFNCVTLGASVSNELNYTASAGLQFEHFKLVYHYDRTTSLITDKQIGSHNLSLRINGSNKKKRSRLN